jgi:excisionase family DNA binding protein
LRKLPPRKAYPIPPTGQISLSLAEVCGLTGLGMTKVREAVQTDLLPVRRLGKKIIVKRHDVDRFLDALPRGFKSTKIAERSV